jgi:hypothetical protein
MSLLCDLAHEQASINLQVSTFQTSQSVVNNFVSFREYAAILNARTAAVTKSVIESC